MPIKPNEDEDDDLFDFPSEFDEVQDDDELEELDTTSSWDKELEKKELSDFAGDELDDDWDDEE